jgi:hypothetical protein
MKKLLTGLIGVAIMTGCAILIHNMILPFIFSCIFCVVGAITLFKLIK